MSPPLLGLLVMVLPVAHHGYRLWTRRPSSTCRPVSFAARNYVRLRRDVGALPPKLSQQQQPRAFSSISITVRNAAESGQPSSAGTPTTATQSVTAHQHFVTPAMQVYIEDTDAYGVMYNGNYLRAYDRALHVTASVSSSELRSNHHTWSIVSVEELKFKSPPPLGGVFCIEGTMRESNCNNLEGHESSASITSVRSSQHEVWDMVMRSPDGSTIYNTATGVTIAQPPSPPTSDISSNICATGLQWLPEPSPFFYSSKDPAYVRSSRDPFVTFRDEFESHLVTHLPLRNALNLMERSRTNWIGGPDKLQQLQEPSDGDVSGILYVVTSVRELSLVEYPIHANNGFGPGSALNVDTTFVIRKRGMIVDCYHTLLSKDGHRHTQGIVTIMALNAKTRRPTNQLPQWLVERMEMSQQ